MENTEILNAEAVEATEKIVENTGMSKGVKIAAGVGLSVLAGVVIYKYVAKPMAAKIKTKIEQNKASKKEHQFCVRESDFAETEI